MIDVVGVKFKTTGKVYYFLPGEIEDLQPGDQVIVETARGMEFGTVTMGITAVDEEEVVKPLKKIVRKATKKDKERHIENESKKAEAMRICQEKVNKHGLDMKLIDVEYTFDNNKVIFYFTADGRVDFRELVKDLASVFCMRIELRQIGVRDEAKIIGGIGSCGRPLCCASWLSDFHPVSIKMAKNQDLSLNPGKISGICGRLMCCLKYENEVYTELKKGMPKKGDRVKTEDGLALVVDSNLLEGNVKVRLFTDEKEEDGSDKLSSDIFVYKKDDVRRLANKKGGIKNQGCKKCKKMKEKTKEKPKEKKSKDRPKEKKKVKGKE